MANYKLIIKATFSNLVHRIIAKPGDKKINYHKLQADLKALPEKKKAELLDQILEQYFKSSNELRNGISKRRDVNRVKRLRQAKLTEKSTAA